MAKPQPSKEMMEQTAIEVVVHAADVANTMECMANQLRARAKQHDLSKLSDEELPYFAEATSLRQLPYGSKKYNDQLAVESALRPALDHHWSHNRHHPEFHEHGMADMTMVDIMEMLSDWWSAGQRHGAGHNIFHSINVNRVRFKIPLMLASIMWSTAIDCFGEEPEDGYDLCRIKQCNACGCWQDQQFEKCTECDCPEFSEV